MPNDAHGIPTRAIIYCRMSRDKEGAGLGVERQREDCEALAASLGVEVIATYSDNDLSAYSGKPRPGYRQLLADLRAGRADTVLAWHTDRLHRSPAELEEYIDVCEPRAVQTRTVKAGHLDLATATGRMIARQLGVQARYEVERMIERAKRTRDQMAEQGKHFGGRRPFGYEEDRITPRSLHCPGCGADAGFTVVQRCGDCGAASPFTPGRACRACEAREGVSVLCVCACGADAQVVEGSEAWHVSTAVNAVLSGTSLHAIMRAWNEEGVLTSTGAQWDATSVRTMLLRPRNAGIVRHRGREAGPAQWPPLVDEERWRSVVSVLSDRRTGVSTERKHLGTGLYECGVCSATVRVGTANKEGDGYAVAYTCRASGHVIRKVAPLDNYVQLLLLDRLSRDDVADLLAARKDPVDVRGAQRAMRQARETLDELAAQLGAGEMDVQEWRVARKAARERLEAAEQVLARAVEVNPVAGLIGAEDIEAEWVALDLSRKRAAIAYMMSVRLLPARRGRLPGGVYFDKDAVDIVWK